MSTAALTSPREIDGPGAVDGDEPALMGGRGDRRGPLRPGRLSSSRTRLSGRALSHTYRAVDAAIISLLACFAWRLATPAEGLEIDVAVLFAFAAAGLIGALAVSGAYGLRPRETFPAHQTRVILAFFAAGLVLVGVLALIAPPSVWRAAVSWLGLTFGSLFILHAVWWRRVRRLRRMGRLTPNIVIVGATAGAERLIAAALNSHDISVLGVFDDRLDRAPDHILGVPVLGDTEALIGHRIMPYVDRVVVTVTAAAQTRVRDLVARLSVLPNEINLLMDSDVAEPAESVRAGQDASAAVLSRLADLPLALVAGRRLEQSKALAKRVQDLVIGVLALLAATPVMIGVALAVKLDSPGPIFFRQRRQGFNNEDIVVWKFRTLFHDQRDETAQVQVQYGDPRVTRVGRILRRTSLDELPQLFNVLTGEMSLVGPRPHAPGMKTGAVESALLVAEYAHRHRMKPGMTGWAAIKGSRGPVDTPELVRRRVALDVEYIERQSFWLDLYILLMTVPCLLGDDDVTR